MSCVTGHSVSSCALVLRTREDESETELLDNGSAEAGTPLLRLVPRESASLRCRKYNIMAAGTAVSSRAFITSPAMLICAKINFTGAC
jgi:hypothetical protein